MLPLIRSLGLEHHITNTSKPDDEITDSSGTKTKNPNAEQWILNDGLLTSWLLTNMKEETLSMILGGETAHYIWSSLHEQLLPNTEDGEAQLKDSLYAMTKGSLSLDEYIRSENSRNCVTNSQPSESHFQMSTKFFKFQKDLETSTRNFALRFYQNHHILHLINLLCHCKILNRFISLKKSHPLIKIKPSLALEEKEVICVEVEAITSDVPHIIILKAVRIKVTTFKPLTQDFHQIPTPIGKHHQSNKTRKLAKYVVEQTTLPLSAITGMNTIM